MNDVPQPNWRKPVGTLGILLYIAVWAVAVASLSATIGGWPAWLQLVFYAVAGIVWIAPLRPVLAWMERRS